MTHAPPQGRPTGSPLPRTRAFPAWDVRSLAGGWSIAGRCSHSCVGATRRVALRGPNPGPIA